MRFDYNTDYRDGLKLLRYRDEWLSYGALLAVLLLAPAVLPIFYVGELSFLFVMGIGSVGLMLLVGYTGQVSLGHAAFMAIGGYAHVILLKLGVPFLASLLCAMLISGAIGLALGLPALRMTGLYLAIATLAFAFIVEHVIGHWKSLTGGHGGIEVPDPVMFGAKLGGVTPFYYVCLALLVVTILGAANLLRGRIGRAWRALRDSETAALSMGINVALYKTLAFGLSAAVCGLAGALLPHRAGYLTPDTYNLLLSMQLLLAVVIGGLGSLHGALFGAVLIGLMPTAISLVKPLLPGGAGQKAGFDILVYGLILVAFVLFEPRGLYGRWLKLKALFQHFPLYRRDTFVKVKSYMKSERYR